MYILILGANPWVGSIGHWKAMDSRMRSAPAVTALEVRDDFGIQKEDTDMNNKEDARSLVLEMPLKKHAGKTLGMPARGVRPLNRTAVEALPSGRVLNFTRLPLADDGYLQL